MYNKGDKVVCINNDNVEDRLTLGKVYIIVLYNYNYDSVLLGDDLYNYHYHRFISLKEYRKNKLNKILCIE